MKPLAQTLLRARMRAAWGYIALNGLIFTVAWFGVSRYLLFDDRESTRLLLSLGGIMILADLALFFRTCAIVFGETRLAAKAGEKSGLNREAAQTAALVYLDSIGAVEKWNDKDAKAFIAEWAIREKTLAKRAAEE